MDRLDIAADSSPLGGPEVEQTSIRQKDERVVRSVVQAFALLEHLCLADTPLGVTELARRTGLNKTTALKLALTLESRNVIARDEKTSRYFLGAKLHELSAAAASRVDLVRAAQGSLSDLSREAAETVLLAVREEDHVLYIDRLHGPGELQVRVKPGSRGPLHATASGKALLASLSPSERFNTLERLRPLKRYTATTIADVESLGKHLAQVEREGFATSWQEHEVGLSSVSMPLRNHEGRVVAALTIVGPAARVSAQSAETHLEKLRAAVAGIQRRVGTPPASGSRYDALEL